VTARLQRRRVRVLCGMRRSKIESAVPNCAILCEMFEYLSEMMCGSPRYAGRQ